MAHLQVMEKRNLFTRTRNLEIIRQYQYRRPGNGFTKRLYAGYHVVANPYVSNIDLSRITRGNDIGNLLLAMEPATGKTGRLYKFPFRNKNILPPLGAFITRSNGNDDNRLLIY
jgi:hypothetical protein